MDTARQIEGCARHISVHACAIVISPTTVQDFSPIQTESGGEKPITQYEMHACEDIGLIKFDILGIEIFPSCVKPLLMSAKSGY